MANNPTRLAALAGAASGAVALAFASSEPAFAQSTVKGLRVIAELVAKPGMADDLRKLLVPFAQGVPKEPGCLSYTLLEVQSEPGHFFTYETWTDAAALDAHLNTPQFKAAGPVLFPMLAKPLSLSKLDALT